MSLAQRARGSASRYPGRSFPRPTPRQPRRDGQGIAAAILGVYCLRARDGSTSRGAPCSAGIGRLGEFAVLMLPPSFGTMTQAVVSTSRGSRGDAGDRVSSGTLLAALLAPALRVPRRGATSFPKHPSRISPCAGRLDTPGAPVGHADLGADLDQTSSGSVPSPGILAIMDVGFRRSRKAVSPKPSRRPMRKAVEGVRRGRRQPTCR